MTDPMKLALFRTQACHTCPPQDALPVVEMLCPHGLGYPVSQQQVPSRQEWEALFALAVTGMNECPYGWDPDYKRKWPGWDEPEFQEAIDCCGAWLKRNGQL